MGVTVPRYTVQDLEHFPDDGNRYELLDGMLLVTELESPAHNLVATRLMVALATTLRVGNEGRVVGRGIVLHSNTTQLEPDVLVFPSIFPVDCTWRDITEHWIAVEVVTQSSYMYDREFKRNAYQRLGIGEVWLVDIRARSVEVWRGLSSEPVVVTGVLEWMIPTSGRVISIPLSELFEGLT
jgi:Uma2 family endonuclease